MPGPTRAHYENAAGMPPNNAPAPTEGRPGAAPMAPPAPEAPPSPEQLMEMEQENTAKKVDLLMETRPTPDKPYSVSAVKLLADQVAAAVDKIAGTEIPLPEWTAEGKGKLVDPETKEPLMLPPEVFIPVAVFVTAIAEKNKEMGDGDYDKYIFDPQELTNDEALKLAASKLKMASNDKSLATALMAPQGEAGLQEDEPERMKTPDDLDENEQMLAENL